MATLTPPTVTPAPQTPSPRRSLLTLRTAVIGALGAIVGGATAAATVMAGLDLAEVLTSTGTAFTGTVAFLNEIIE